MKPTDINSGLTVERLKQVLRYEPDTGEFVWLRKPTENARVTVGSVAGRIDKFGYVNIYIDGRGYFAQRLAWLYMKGAWPEALIDHEDTDRANNRWNNLRPASNSQNKANGAKYVSAAPLPKGVTLAGNKYRAQIVHNYQHQHLGYFDKPAAAHAAYLHAAARLHGEFARAA